MFPISTDMCQPDRPEANLSLSTMLNKKENDSIATTQRLERLKVLFQENPALEEALQIITELELNRY